MNQNTALDWRNVDWKRFQTICIHIAERLYPGIQFNDYLKPGAKQYGIDLISNINQGKYITIQCKETKISVNELDNIVKEFKPKFRDHSSIFILATTSDLQFTEFQNKIMVLQQGLWHSDKIEFIVWDIDSLEKSLKNYYSVVADFFSLEQADRYCFQPLRSLELSFEDLGDEYISRKIMPLEDKKDPFSWAWTSKHRSSFLLTEKLFDERLGGMQMCILGDPYQGKSELLRQSAIAIKKFENPLSPLFIELKANNVKPIEQQLNAQYGAWKGIPMTDIVLFIDGLDEVPTEEFMTAFKYIIAFCDLYPSLKIVYSCRKLFYYHYNLNDWLRSSQVFELDELSNQEISTYTNRVLVDRATSFREKVYEYQLNDLLGDPFYLKELVKSFSTPPFTLAKSKSLMVENFIGKSIEKSMSRQIDHGRNLRHVKVSYQAALQKLAISLQILGLNSMDSTTMQQLFSLEETSLLQHGAFITQHNGHWFFTSAIFQEYLAARVLSKFEFSTVIKLVSVGEKIVKIREKWLQTYATLLSILDKEDPKRKKYIEILEADNIELLFNTDRSKYSEEYRLYILEKLIERSKKTRFRPMLIHERKIGSFLTSDETAINFLCSEIKRPKNPDFLKDMCMCILRSCSLDTKQRQKAKKLALSLFNLTSEAFIAKTCVSIATMSGKFDSDTATSFSSNVIFNKDADYRSVLYRYLIEGNLSDKFLKYALDGIPILIAHNSKITRSHSEYELIHFLGSIKTFDNIKITFKRIANSDWNSFMTYREDGQHLLLSMLIENCVQLYGKQPKVFNVIIAYIKQLNKREINNIIAELEPFFEKTNTQGKLFQTLKRLIYSQQGYRFAGFLNESSVKEIAESFELNKGNTEILWTIAYGLDMAKKTALSQILKQKYWAIKSAEPKSEPDHHDKWQALEKLKAENDLKYFQSQEALETAIRNFFSSFNKARLTDEDLYVEVESAALRQAVASNYMYALLNNWVKAGKKIKLSDALKFIHNKEIFEAFKVKYAFGKAKNNEQSIYYDYLKSYYDKEITVTSFENTIYYKGKNLIQKRKPMFLAAIYETFELETPIETLIDLLWTNDSGSKCLRTIEGNTNKSVALKIFEKTFPAHAALMASKISAALKKGILAKGVFGTFAAFADKLNLTGLKDVILARILSKDIDGYEIADLSKIYLNLGGRSKELLPAFKSSIKTYSYIEMADLLIKDEPKAIMNSLSAYIKDSQYLQEQKIDAATRLSMNNEFEGFQYLVDYITANGISPIYIQGKFSVANLSTRLVIDKIEPLMHHVLDDDTENFSKSARSILIEWVRTLALKSEADVRLITELLQRCSEKYHLHEKAYFFNWHIEQCLENFRDNANHTMSLASITALIDGIPIGEFSFS